MANTSKTAKTADNGAAVLEKIGTWPEPFKTMGLRLYEIFKESAPGLQPRIWYGMPGYAASASGPVLCFFRFDSYMTFGLTEHVRFAREDGAKHGLMNSAWFFTELDAATEAEIARIVGKAAGTVG